MALKINFNDIRKANIHKKKKERRGEGERCCCADDVTDIKIESFTHFLSNIFICIKVNSGSIVTTRRQQQKKVKCTMEKETEFKETENKVQYHFTIFF